MWHKVQFGLFGRKAYLSVDNIINTGLLPPGETVIVSKEIIYLGKKYVIMINFVFIYRKL